MKNLYVLTALLLSAAPAWADNPLDLPAFGTTNVAFAACSAEGHVVNMQMKLSNFSAFDTSLPTDGKYVWATKEEMFAAATPLIQAEIPVFVAADNDAKITTTDAYMANLLQTQTTIHGQLEDGRVGDWPVQLDLKIGLETKMALMAVGKYSAVSFGFDPAATFAKVDATKTCTPVKK